MLKRSYSPSPDLDRINIIFLDGQYLDEYIFQSKYFFLIQLQKRLAIKNVIVNNVIQILHKILLCVSVF